MIDEIELRLTSGDFLQLGRGQELVSGRDHKVGHADEGR